MCWLIILNFNFLGVSLHDRHDVAMAINGMNDGDRMEWIQLGLFRSSAIRFKKCLIMEIAMVVFLNVYHFYPTQVFVQLWLEYHYMT